MGPALDLPTPKGPPGPSSKRAELSGNITIVLIFVTHGFVNSLLLCSWNPIRCAYWNRYSCTDDEAWVLNWLSFGTFHLCLLLSCLGLKAQGKAVFEQRLVYLCTAIMLSYLSSGLFMIDQINKPMAAVQVIIYFGLLAIVTYMTATVPPFPILSAELRSSSFDSRRKLPICSASLAFLFLLSLIRLVDMSFGTGMDGYLGDQSSTVYKSISKACTVQMMWCTLILGSSVLLASPEQQKNLLVGQVVALFISQCMLAGEQGEKIEGTQLQVGGMATFGSILLGLLGIF